MICQMPMGSYSHCKQHNSRLFKHPAPRCLPICFATVGFAAGCFATGRFATGVSGTNLPLSFQNTIFGTNFGAAFGACAFSLASDPEKNASERLKPKPFCETSNPLQLR